MEKQSAMTNEKTCSSLESLLEIMRILRTPDGCPWDIQQTPESLTPYILEEACELIDAIESGDPRAIREELGDLLLQVVFQAQIFDEQGQFDFEDVATGIADKLVRRHPHVFAKRDHDDHATDLDAQWEKIKNAEAYQKKSCLADHLPNSLPALQRAQKLVSRSAKANRLEDLPNVDVLRAKLSDLDRPTATQKLAEEELGRLFFALVRLSYASGIDAESALRRVTTELLRQLDD
jgi:MazG family protein